MRNLILPLLVFAVGPLARADLPDPVTFHSSKVTVVFQHPDKFQDIRDMYMPTDKGEVGFLGIFGNYIVSTADDLLPEGYHLTMTFTDVKYAGDLRPAIDDENRIIRSIFPPHYKFTYQVTDGAGKVIKQDNVNLLDINFQLNMSRADDTGPLRVDKDEINDWLGRNLRHLK